VKLVYLAGAPATGKSTLMAALTHECKRQAALPSESLIPCDKLYRNNERVGIELGRYRPNFPGTDTLSFSIIGKCERFWSLAVDDLVLGEGDRLSKARFFIAARNAGYDVHLVHLDAPIKVLDERCERRGSTQDVTWRRGRGTAARKLAISAEEAGVTVHYLDSSQPTADLVRILVDRIPELQALGSVDSHVYRTTAI
jgi:P-loop Nucleotide Kinase3